MKNSGHLDHGITRRVQKRSWDLPDIHWHGTWQNLYGNIYFGWAPCSSNYCPSTKKGS